MDRAAHRRAATRRRRRRLRLSDGRRGDGRATQRRIWPGLFVAALPGLAAVAAVLFTLISVGQTKEELRISREAQITGRYTAAVAGLGSASADVRVGGIYALERIMRDSPRDQATGLSVLAAYVRAHARLPATDGARRATPAFPEPLPVDLQAAVTVLANRPVDSRDTTRLRLRYVSLRGLADMGDLDRARQDLNAVHYGGMTLRSPEYRANLLRADLAGADLREASLVRAGLGEALLAGADLRRADLREADLGNAVLAGADLRGANLTQAGFSSDDLRGVRLGDVKAQRAFFTSADLRGVDLRGADLRHAFPRRGGPEGSRPARRRSVRGGSERRASRGLQTRGREPEGGEARTRRTGAGRTLGRGPERPLIPCGWSSRNRPAPASWAVYGAGIAALPSAVTEEDPVPSPCDPKYAPAGDVGGALMVIDSRLRSVYEERARPDPEQQRLIRQFTASLGPSEVQDLLDGTCTVIFMFMKWLRQAHEEHDKDVIEYVVPGVVAAMRSMPKSVRAEAIPTMAGLVVAAGTGLSPSLWRKQYGEWTSDEMNPLEATAFLLAEHINRITDDREFATRLIADALSRVDKD